MQTEGTGVDVYTTVRCSLQITIRHSRNTSISWALRQLMVDAEGRIRNFQRPHPVPTNCIVPPKKDASYLDKVYTTGSSGFTDSNHIAERPAGGRKDFSEIIEHAKL